MPWVYIFECADGTFYVGSTIDLDGRVSQHNDRRGSAYTRRAGRRPVKLVWAADFYRVDEAFAFEKRVAGWRRRWRLSHRGLANVLWDPAGGPGPRDESAGGRVPMSHPPANEQTIALALRYGRAGC